MMFIVRHGGFCKAELSYVIGLVLSDFLGLAYVETTDSTDGIQISFGDKTLNLADDFFRQADAHWLQVESLPRQPLQHLDAKASHLPAGLVRTKLPVLYGRALWEPRQDGWRLGVDIFGSIFFLLSRYEEAIIQDRDTHGRIPCHATIAAIDDICQRPLANEYIELLWYCLQQIWPQLERKKRDFRMLVSGDVDRPYEELSGNLRRTLLRAGGDIVRRADLKESLRVIMNYGRAHFGDHRLDRLYKFDWMMDEWEKRGIRGAFYFVAANTGAPLDARYDLQDRDMRALLKRVHQRGHELGLHFSYHSVDDAARMGSEYVRMQELCRQHGIEQDSWGSRQHYLRWSTPATWRNLDRVGIRYDATLGFAERAGFRCGICYEYRAYDVVGRQALSIVERPLVLMECSVMADCYMGLGHTREAVDYMAGLKNTCRQFNGDFTLLWHNSHLTTDADREMYQHLLG